jgi:hypothetical protein
VKILTSEFHFKYLNYAAGSITDIAQFTCKGRQLAVLQSWKTVSLDEDGRNIANGPGHLVRRSLQEGRKLRSYLTENTACLFYKDQSVAVI